MFVDQLLLDIVDVFFLICAKKQQWQTSDIGC